MSSSSDEPSPNAQPVRRVHVDLGPRAYDIVIGRGLLTHLPGLMAERDLKGPFVVITDKRVAHHHRDAVEKILAGADLDYFVLDVEPGEPAKSLAEFTRLLSELAKLKLPRSGTILALGGGVIGDLAGYVAASYLRGIAFVQVPTTLLAMVDSSVGGKTGVNLPEGKNLVGAFYQPKLVMADLDTLKTLPAREFSAGMAEVIKYGAIADRELFDRVAKGVTPEDADLAEIIETCVAIKARIVKVDEFETGTQRALLNFGHTIGHAIEKALTYCYYVHGEAVALGMVAAARLSELQTDLSPQDTLKIRLALANNHLPVGIEPNPEKPGNSLTLKQTILEALGNDKKVATDGKNRWVLLKGLGEATSGWEVPADLVEKVVTGLIYSEID